MATTDLAEQQLLINGEWRAAQSGRTFETRNPYTGEVASSATRGRRARTPAPPSTPRTPRSRPGRRPAPGARRAMLSRAADLLIERQNEIAETMIEETGGNLRLGDVQLHARVGNAARGRGADLRHGRRGDPLRHPRQARDGGSRPGRRRRRDRAVERAGDPLHARRRDAAGLRQHRRAQGLRAVPAHARARRRPRSPTPASRPASSTSSPTRRRTPPRSSRS